MDDIPKSSPRSRARSRSAHGLSAVLALALALAAPPVVGLERLRAARCSQLLSPGPAIFAVQEFRSGRNIVGSYRGAGTSIVLAPAGPERADAPA